MSRTSYDVASLGELLIDFTGCGTNDRGIPLYEANPGGATANVAAMLCKLGRSCAYLSKVGRDSFGAQLIRTMEGLGVDCRGILKDEKIPTTLAVVTTLPGGDRDFSFYRKPGADVMLGAEELDEAALTACRIFHFGTLSLTGEPCRTATRRALELARGAGAVISLDPNLRPPLWDSLDEAREQIDWALDRADVVKIADNELEFMTGKTDFDAGAAELLARHPNIRLLNVTAGAGGSYAYYGGLRVFAPACPFGGTIETTGAGDTFCACVLHYLLDHELNALDGSALFEMLRFANAAAYLTTTRRGGIPAMPERAEIDAVLERMKKESGT